MNQSKLYISPSVVIESMRDNGYKNTAYATAELIDNSIQAGATCVRLACFEKYKTRGKQIEQIAIIDDGKGMPSDVLHLALEFGGSKHREDEKGMGKFGMGLPNSSVSQCRLTEVWSWTNPEEILYTFLDIDKIKNKEIESIPAPIAKELPEHIKQAFNGEIPNSGTVVLWSNLDRLHWKTSKSIKLHTEALIGRIYRRQLSEESKYNENRNPLRIVFQCYEFNDLTKSYLEISSESFKANDPLYLYSDTTLPHLPAPLSKVSAFAVKDFKNIEVEYEEGKFSTVTIRTSTIKPEVAKILRSTTGDKIGSTIWGRHMKKNIGLSVVRANRELDLISDYYIADSNYLDRYLGIEVEFEPVLDQFFGVTNNKQSANKIKYIPLDVLAAEVIDTEGKTKAELESEYLDYLSEEAPVDAKIADINSKIKQMIVDAYNSIKSIGFDGLKNTSDNVTDNSKIPTDPVNIQATKAESNRAEEFEIEGDEAEPDVKGIKELLINEGMPEEEVEKTIQEIITNNLKVKFEYRDGLDDFFDIASFQGFTLIRINTAHSFYSKFMQNANEDERNLLNLCLAAWGRMEKEVPPNIMKECRNTRRRWSNMLEEYLGETVE
ncbi:MULTISPECIES: ATP-binding protein [Acinetobacter]|uniref:ATP-binding protein n=1 Tax=Acinetobacter TaxID=469 RepID=UPI001443BEB4|nr:ATP-binding protein [Acinetobacter indicus]